MRIWRKWRVTETSMRKRRGFCHFACLSTLVSEHSLSELILGYTTATEKLVPSQRFCCGQNSVNTTVVPGLSDAVGTSKM
jgi:hypothetical protein